MIRNVENVLLLHAQAEKQRSTEASNRERNSPQPLADISSLVSQQPPYDSLRHSWRALILIAFRACADGDCLCCLLIFMHDEPLCKTIPRVRQQSNPSLQLLRNSQRACEEAVQITACIPLWQTYADMHHPAD